MRQSRRLVITLDKEGYTELSLAKVTLRDAGNYCCTAVNEVGRAETSCQVIVQPSVGIPAQPSVIPPLLSSSTNDDLPYVLFILYCSILFSNNLGKFFLAIEYNNKKITYVPYCTGETFIKQLLLKRALLLLVDLKILKKLVIVS